MSYKKNTIDELPELPLESLSLGGSLEPAFTAPVLTIRPDSSAAPEGKNPSPRPPSTLHCPKSSSHYVKKYLTQVTYPRVICHPENELSTSVVQKVFQEHQGSPDDNATEQAVDSRQTQFYKLSSFKGTKLNNPYFCSVQNGPWSATVRETQGCRTDCNVPTVSWHLSVNGLPEIDIAWEGEWEDIPVYNYPNLSVIMGDLYLVNEGSECCPGFTFCSTTNSCIPSTVQCHGTQTV
jgi:hypothetical protein